MIQIITAFNKLKSYCEAQNFKGWDPYDGLNSKIFQATFFKNWDLARLAWIQAFKRSPINLRKLLLVPKQYNAKGVGLFLNGYCNLYYLAKNGSTEFGTTDAILTKIHALSKQLLKMQNTNYSGACWGYNFDWQARRLFLFPKDTPTVVATSFVATALFEAYEITKDTSYLNTALSASNFILNDLNRTAVDDGFILSYSPLAGNNTVYNASLLGAKTLSYCYKYTKNETFKKMAETIVRTVCNGQQADGSWVYGLLKVQSWIDSFHTGYNLDAIAHYQLHCQDNQFEKHLETGLDFYINNFFLNDGTPKYYHNKTYPIDIHCPGQLWVTLAATKSWHKNEVLAEKVMQWTLSNMQDKDGYFYYQIKKGISSKIPYMRWSNGFMFNAMSCYLKNKITPQQ